MFSIASLKWSMIPQLEAGVDESCKLQVQHYEKERSPNFVRKRVRA